jgi:hypothetical protein
MEMNWEVFEMGKRPGVVLIDKNLNSIIDNLILKTFRITSTSWALAIFSMLIIISQAFIL